MNDFIKLRNKHVTDSKKNRFSFVYLDYFKQSQSIRPQEKEFINQLQSIFQLNQKEQITLNEMIDMLSYLGSNVYVNQAIVNLFVKNKALFHMPTFEKEVVKKLEDKELTELAVYALVDSCIECDSQLLSTQLLSELLNKSKKHFDLFSLIIDYFHYFKITGFEDQIYRWLAEDYPLTIKIQLIDLLVELSSKDQTTDFSFSPKDQAALNHYVAIFKQEPTASIEGLTILQSMFYGDFENSGKGNNGGLAIFLKSLGTELSHSEKIARMITLTITNKWSINQSLITPYAKDHLFIRIPIYVDKSNPTDFLKKEHFIKRTVQRFLDRLELTPDVFHVRFLDNASRAIASLSKEQDKKLVLTLTPDPHRNMTNQTGEFAEFNFNEFIERLNKIIIGDELIAKSDQIVGIGNKIVKKELDLYFPQLLQKENQIKVRMISEGIQTDLALINIKEKAMTNQELEKIGITKKFLEKPIILNVGRLNQLKAQDQLLKAWGNSELSEVYHLLIIGGDLENPDREEKAMMETFGKYLQKNVHLQEKFCHLGALSNYQVRKIEKKIRAKQGNYPQIYLCSSKKEEFGIAILEALSQELLVLAPEKGGVKSYLTTNVNGFLIDTSSWQSIAAATEEIINSLSHKKTTFEQIQKAGEKTVKDHFSLATIAADFLTLYLSLQEKE